MGLYLLNISIDTADHNPEFFPEDLTFNDQESIVEIIVEQVLGYEDAIIEYDDNDTEEQNKKIDIKIKLMSNNLAVFTLSRLPNETKLTKFPSVDSHLTSGFLQIDSPPPKA